MASASDVRSNLAAMGFNEAKVDALLSKEPSITLEVALDRLAASSDDEMVDASPSAAPNSPTSSSTPPVVAGPQTQAEASASAAGASGDMDAALSEAIQASLKDAQLRAMATNGDFDPRLVFQDPKNPYDRKRASDDIPVGLKNVGNTCYFNGLVQSYFAISAFRDAIFQARYVPKELLNVEQDPRSLILELQLLFAKLTLSQRKYVDPTDVLRALYGVKVGNQEDPTEFNMTFMERLHNGFTFDANATSSSSASTTSTPETFDAQTSDPITDLFTFTTLQSIKAEEGDGQLVENSEKETQMQLILGIDEASDLYGALDQYVDPERVQDFQTPRGHRTTAVRSVALTSLPTVLTIQLQRVSFNKATLSQTKNNKRLPFPRHLHMDRYLVKNADVVNERRTSVTLLRQRMASLRRALKRLTGDYCGKGSGSLVQSLSTTMRFLQERKAIIMSHATPMNTSDEAVDAATPSTPTPSGTASQAASLPVVEADTKLKSEAMSKDDDGVAGDDRGGDTEGSDGTPSTAADGSDDTTALSESQGGDLDEEALSDVWREGPFVVDLLPNEGQQCGTLMRQLDVYVEAVKAQSEYLSRELATAQQQLDSTFDDIQEHEYTLHAVLIHDGAPNMGHYWVYILDHATNAWRKFNDIHVTVVDESEVMQKAEGGDGLASAYCLVYVESCKMASSMSETARIPQELAELCERDNEAFNTECSEWDQKDVDPEAKKMSELRAEILTRMDDLHTLRSKWEQSLRVDAQGASSALYPTTTTTTTASPTTATPTAVTNAAGEGPLEDPRLIDLRHFLFIGMDESELAFMDVVKPLYRQYYTFEISSDTHHRADRVQTLSALLDGAPLVPTNEHRMRLVKLRTTYDRFRRITQSYLQGLESIMSEAYERGLDVLMDTLKAETRDQIPQRVSRRGEIMFAITATISLLSAKGLALLDEDKTLSGLKLGALAARKAVGVLDRDSDDWKRFKLAWEGPLERMRAGGFEAVLEFRAISKAISNHEVVGNHYRSYYAPRYTDADLFQRYKHVKELFHQMFGQQ